MIALYLVVSLVLREEENVEAGVSRRQAVGVRPVPGYYQLQPYREIER